MHNNSSDIGMGSIRWRFVFVALNCAGVMILNITRVNVVVGLLSMVNSTMFTTKYLNRTSECVGPLLDNSIDKYVGRSANSFLWSETQQSSVISAFYWGYAIFQIPTGILTMYVDIKKIVILSNFVYIVCTFLCPLAANLGVNYLIVTRFIIGLGQSPYMSCLYAACSRWVLDDEKSIMMSIISVGGALGIIVGQSMSGFLASEVGWEWIFYVSGLLGVVWWLLYIFLITNDPSQHRFMSNSEKNLFLTRNVALFRENKSRKRIPLLDMFRSLPFLAIIIIHSSYNFTWYIIMNSLPYYVGLVLGFPIAQNGVISSAPYFCFIVFLLLSAFFCQWLQSKRVMTVTRQRKTFICIFTLLAAATQYLISSTGCNVEYAILLVCTTMSLMAISYVSIGVNYLDIAPRLSGIVVSISNTIANFSGFIQPYIKAYFTQTGETRENWWYMFFTGSIVMVFGSVSYLFLGSGEAQLWDSDNSRKEIPILLEENEAKETFYVSKS